MQRINRRKQKGFTLIELIIVIVIVAILAAVAIPKFLNLQQDAAQAATDGIAGSMASASAANYAIRSGFATKGQAVTTCTNIGTLLQGGMPAGYSVNATALGNGLTADCTVTGGGSPATTKIFTGHGIT